MSYRLRPERVTTPNVVGRTFYDAARETCKHGVSLVVAATKQEQNMPLGTVLTQKPLPGQPIKRGQSLYVTTVVHPLPILSPLLYGKSMKEAQQIVQPQGIHLEPYYLQSNYPQDTVFCQYPEPGDTLTVSRVIVYISSKGPTYAVMPRLINVAVSEVNDLMSSYDVQIHCICKDPLHNVCDGGCRVVDQRPNAGQVVDLSSKIHIYVQCQHFKERNI
jgi:beta-lactam-binding protein with PASTA domain